MTFGLLVFQMREAKVAEGSAT